MVEKNNPSQQRRPNQPDPDQRPPHPPISDQPTPDHPATERGERQETGKTIGRGGKDSGAVPGAQEHKHT